MSEPTPPVRAETASAPPAPGAAAPAKPKSSKRRGIVLIAVLIVVASLSLAGYHYSDSMTSEYKASENAHRSVQARAFAAAWVHYTAAMLSNPENFTNLLNGNPWNNPSAFQGIAVNADGNPKGRFSIIAAPAPDDNSDPAAPYFGVTDESSKINPNALMKLDSTGQRLHDVLVLLPNMTEDIANSVIAWMGGSVGTQNGGATNDVYMSLNPPYRIKGGPIDSIDELLLVRGITRDLLYGSDSNRNGTQETNEIGPNGFDRGWSACLTVHSREQNSDASGMPYVWLMNTDLNQMFTLLTNGGVSDELATFVVMFRQYPKANAKGGAQSLGSTIASMFGGGGGGNNTSTVTGDISTFKLSFTKTASYQINTIYDLIGSSVTVTTIANKKTVNTVYACPLNDATKLADQFPKLFAIATTLDPTANPELPARINVLTAPKAVLLTFQPDLTPADVDNIIAARPPLSSTDTPDPIFASPIWLMSKAQVSQAALTKLDSYITTRSQVYRVQSVGYFEDRGPAIRVEAVIDTNAGRPRILAWRDMSELGKGWSEMPSSSSP